MASTYDKLAPHLQRLVDAHMLGVTGADAVRKIRPELKRPEKQASVWLARKDVKAAIAERKAEAKAAAILTQEKWDQAIADIAFVKHARKAIKPEHSVRALELGGRRLGLYKDSAGERTPIGPGLTVVVQQIVQTSAGPGQATVTGQRVDVRLPGPAAPA